MQSFASNNMKRRQIMQAEELRKKKELQDQEDAAGMQQQAFQSGPNTSGNLGDTVSNIARYGFENRKALGQFGSEIGNVAGDAWKSASKTVGGWFK